jgi:hypothetical protein
VLLPGVFPVSPPAPPPAEVIVEKVETPPLVLGVAPFPPAPTTIGKAVAVTVILFGELG